MICSDLLVEAERCNFHQPHSLFSCHCELLADFSQLCFCMYRSQRSHRYEPLQNSSAADEQSENSSRRASFSLPIGMQQEPASVLLNSLQQQQEDESQERARREAASNSLWGRCSRFAATLQSKPRFCERTIYLGAAASDGSPDGPPFPGMPAVAASTIGASGSLCEPALNTFPANVVRNQKYHLITFLPHFLYEQFSFFFNFYFLIVALSQFIPVLQIGFLFTYGQRMPNAMALHAGQ
jgi:hypothetical protein